MFLNKKTNIICKIIARIKENFNSWPSFEKKKKLIYITSGRWVAHPHRRPKASRPRSARKRRKRRASSGRLIKIYRDAIRRRMKKAAKR